MVQHRRALPTHSWQYKALAATYTVLLGFVLPFVCWGTLATPGHPHRMAHLVFYMPPVRTEAPVKRTDTVYKGHLHSQHDDTLNMAEPQPVGRSVPDELVSAISIISPLFVVQFLLLISPTRSIFRLSRINTVHLFDPIVMTPPPQRLYS